MQKEKLLKLVSEKYQKKKLDKRNTFLSLVQIQKRIKTTTIQIKRKNILTKNEDEKLIHTSNMRLKECNLSKP